jgi:hypothetical protein
VCFARLWAWFSEVQNTQNPGDSGWKIPYLCLQLLYIYIYICMCVCVCVFVSELWNFYSPPFKILANLFVKSRSRPALEHLESDTSYTLVIRTVSQLQLSPLWISGNLCPCTVIKILCFSQQVSCIHMHKGSLTGLCDHEFACTRTRFSKWHSANRKR